jgi:hypothetical protein
VKVCTEDESVKNNSGVILRRSILWTSRRPHSFVGSRVHRSVSPTSYHVGPLWIDENDVKYRSNTP